MQPPPDQNAAGIPIGPVATHVLVSQAQVGADQAILLQISTPVGLSAYFISPDAAVHIGQALEKVGAAARTGLIIGGNGNGHLPPERTS